MALRKLLAPTLTLFLGGLAGAQDLAGLLPEETFFALGMQDLESVSAQLGDFSDEFNRLDVMGALSTLAASQDGMSGGASSGGAGSSGAAMNADDLSAEEKEALGTLASLDVLGQEAWIALSASTVSPLPALTLVTRVTPEGAEKVQALLDSAGGDQPVQELEESGIPFSQLQLENDSPVQVLAYSLSDDLLALSSNPDELRGVLRRYAGADEPNFLSSQGYSSTLGTLEAGTFYSFFNYARIADVAAPYAQNMGFDPLVTRLRETLATAGSVGSVIAVTEDGLTSDSFQALDRQGGDAALYALLSSETPAVTDVNVPEGALAFTANAFDVSGWYDYLNELALSVPELGGDLDSLVLSFTGLSLRESLISWAGDQLLTVTTGFATATEPGVPSENLLGEQVFLVQASNEAAAQRGLDNLFGSLSQLASGLASPEGGAQAPQSEKETVAGAEVTRYELAPGATILYAVNGGYALIGTSDDAMQRALTAQGEGTASELFADVPGAASGYTYSDDQATFQNLAQQLSSTIQTAAGMGGAQGLDFDAVETSSSTVEEFLGFVATRLTTTTSYSETSAEGIRSHAESQVDWEE